MEEIEEFAKFATEGDFDSLPNHVKEKTKLAILNSLAVTIGANNDPESKTIISMAKKIQNGKLPIFGSGITSGLFGAVLANSALSHILDFDDTHLKAFIHPSAPVIPTALMVGIENHKNGKDLIYAATLGMEFEIRLGLALGLDETYSQWHNTSLCGTAASALTVSILNGGNANKVASAILHGLTSMIGSTSNFGTMSKSFQVGRSAAEGIVSAIAAEENITVSRKMLETFAKLATKGYKENYNLKEITENLGKVWNVMDNFLKPYPCCVGSHPGIDAVLMLKNNNIKFSEVNAIDIFINPIVLALAGNSNPKTGLEAKFSIAQIIALAMKYGKLYPEHFVEKEINDPFITAIRRKIRLHSEKTIGRGQTRIELTTDSGQKIVQEINRGDRPSGELKLSDVHEKFNHLVNPVMKNSNEIWNFFQQIETANDISEISRLFS
ncbi:MAG: MmgE/PrpD family protein [Conexivisphaerales archaeon]